jgi:hypothetical protein
LNRRVSYLIALILGATCFVPRLSAQAQQDTSSSMLQVYVQCSYCDMDYIKTEVNYVAHVRERQDADVHVQLLEDRTGGGGTRYTLEFLGQRNHSGINDTTVFVAVSGISPDSVRKGLVRQIHFGLFRYVRNTSVASRLQLSFQPPTPAAAGQSGSVSDPWNGWTVSLSLSGFFQGESSYSSRNIYGTVQAERVTEEWKTTLRLGTSRYSSRFELDSVTEVTSRKEEYDGNVLVANSLNEHWSVGALGAVLRSRFRNYNHRVRGGPAIEYNIFPYKESTRKALAFRYSLGVVDASYQDSTIFNRLSEFHFDHSLTISLDLRQRWGSIGLNAHGYQLLDQPDARRLQAYGEAEVQLFKGLSLSLWGQVTQPRDQLNLRKQVGTPTEILLREYEQQTEIQYLGSVSLRYRFGSRFANKVNTRFAN